MASDGERDEEIGPMDKTSVVQSDTFKVRIAQADSAPPCVVLLVGPANQVGRQWPIEKSDYIIGRAIGAHIQVEDRSLSKSHAKLILKNGELSILDLESTNKTVVNNKLLTPLQPHRLKNNDQIKAGNIIFKFLERGNIETVSVFNKSRLLGAPMSIMVMDIDYFKKVNDTYGHPAGDAVLKEFARVIRDTLIRGNDFFARYGGEEFCLLLLGSPYKQVQEIAERIRRTMQEHKFEHNDKVIPITISVGVAAIQETDTGWNDIFERADKGLYASKNGGRNRVTAT
jgi:two-component system, cell cycle response regulator